MKRETVLITGDKGFIGSHLSKVISHDYNVIGWDLRDDYDIFDSQLEAQIRGVDAVIHLAALTNVNSSFKTPGKFFKVNVLGSARVAELCCKYRKKLIYPSSAAIYHPELSPYAMTKKLAEDIVWGVRDIIPIVVLRLYNVFGNDMDPDTGSLMYNFLTSKKLVIFGDGEQTRDFIHIKDVVGVMTDAVKKKWDNHVVDIGTGEAYSTNYIAGLFAFYQKKKMVYEKPRREIKWSVAPTQVFHQLYKEPLYTNIEHNIRELCESYED